MTSSSVNQSICLLAVVIWSLALGTIDAQNVPSCASNLVPCFAYMNVTKPPESCCKPLNETISTQLTCLCNLYGTPGLLPSFGVNVTEALTLPARCGLSGDLSACGGTAQSPGTSTTPSTTPAGTDKNGAEKVIACAEILGLILFLNAIM